MAVMTVDRDAAVELFSELGLSKSAPKWTDEVLLKKIDGLGEIVRAVGKEGLPKKGSPNFKLLKELVQAKIDQRAFVLSGGKDEEDEEDDDPELDADDEGGEDGEDDGEDDREESGDDEDDTDDDDGAEDGADEDSDDEPDTEDEGDDDMSEAVATKKAPKKADKKPAAKAGKKAAPPAKKGGDGKPGIIASIVEFLQGATSEKAALSKKDILSKLTKRFPDSDADGMMKTINAQVPNRLIAQKGINVVKTDDKRFYVAAAAKPKKAK